MPPDDKIRIKYRSNVLTLQNSSASLCKLVRFSVCAPLLCLSRVPFTDKLHVHLKNLRVNEFAKEKSLRERKDVLRLVERTMLVHSVLRVLIAFSFAVSLLSTRNQILRYRNSTGFGRFLFTVKMQIFDACLLCTFLSYSRIQQQANAIAHLIAASDQDRHSDSETTK